MTRNQFNKQSSLVGENLSLVSCNHFKSLPFFVVYSEKYPAFKIYVAKDVEITQGKNQSAHSERCYSSYWSWCNNFCVTIRNMMKDYRQWVLYVYWIFADYLCYLMVNKSEKLFAVIQFVSTTILSWNRN